MKRIIFLLSSIMLLALVFVPQTFAEEGPMTAANALYENGRYAEAIQVYQQLVDQGAADANLFYNLGNAYYQSGELGSAILNYRRAETLAPRDADIQHNLALARQQAQDQFKQEPDTLAAILLANGSEKFSLNEMAVGTLLLFSLLCLSIFAVRNLKTRRLKTTLKFSLAPLLLLFVLAVFSLSRQLPGANEAPDAVVVAAVAEVYSGPGVQYGSDYQVHSGAEVDLFQTRGDWSQIGIPGSAARAWVAVDAVMPVNN